MYGIRLSPAIYRLIRAAVEEHQVTDDATPAPGRLAVREQARRTRRDNSLKQSSEISAYRGAVTVAGDCLKILRRMEEQLN